MGATHTSKCKICRRNRVKLFLKGARCHTAKCAIEKRNFVPGGSPGNVQRKMSEFGRGLREKQKLRFFYGVSEQQTRNYYATASSKSGVAAENLLRLFERRLDNVVFRVGRAPSRRSARQLVLHGHVKVNGRRVDIPSALVKVGDLVVFGETENHVVAAPAASVVPWISQGDKETEYRVVSYPDTSLSDAPVEWRLVVEFYSR